jgi:hypothetical protein
MDMDGSVLVGGKVATNGAAYPGTSAVSWRADLLLGEGDKEVIEEIMSKYLIKQKPEATWFDKAAKWIQEKVPLESDDGEAGFL